MTTLAIGNESSRVTIKINTVATAIETANEPNAAPRWASSIRALVLAKREPTNAPSVTTEALPIHQGRAA